MSREIKSLWCCGKGQRRRRLCWGNPQVYHWLFFLLIWVQMPFKIQFIQTSDTKPTPDYAQLWMDYTWTTSEQLTDQLVSWLAPFLIQVPSNIVDFLQVFKFRNQSCHWAPSDYIQHCLPICSTVGWLSTISPPVRWLCSMGLMFYYELYWPGHYCLLLDNGFYDRPHAPPLPLLPISS